MLIIVRGEINIEFLLGDGELRVIDTWPTAICWAGRH